VSGGIRDMQGAAEPYLAAAAERLSHLELLHTLHRVEMVMAGMEITRWHEALHSLAGYYACLLNSLVPRRRRRRGTGARAIWKTRRRTARPLSVTSLTRPLLSTL